MKRKNISENGASTGYLSAIILGLNDALVELTGALAGFTMALQNNKLILLAGFTTGIAATLSMAASEFLSQQAEPTSNSYKSAFFTGVAYLITVAILLTPFCLCARPLPALGLCLFLAALIILVFTLVTARLRHKSFLHEFLQMICISFSVAAIAFGITWAAKIWWGIEV